jgi:hypothetical protein
MEMISDPILDSLQTINPAGASAVFLDMFEVSPEIFASYDNVPMEYIIKLAASTDPKVRVVVARRPDCPLDVLVQFVTDSDEKVRSAVAGNSSTPLSAAVVLADDPDEWVRWQIACRTDLRDIDGLCEKLSQDPADVVRRRIAQNPSAPAEVLLSLASDKDSGVRFSLWENPSLTDELKAAFVLAGSTSRDESHVMIDQYLKTGVLPESDDDMRTLAECRDLSLVQLREIFEANNSRQMGRSYAVRSSLASHPSADEQLLEDLVLCARQPEEWGNLWRHYFPTLWPSTRLFSDPDVHHDTLEILTMAGHPAGLLRVDFPEMSPLGDPGIGVAQLINSELMIRALWRELALAGVFQINAWNDDLDGSKFYLNVDRTDLMDSSGPIARLLGGYSEDREWVDLRDYLSVDDATRALSRFGEELEFDSSDENDLNFAMCAAIAFAEENTNDVKISDQGLKYIHEIALNNSEAFDAFDYTTEVVIVDTALPEIGFEKLSEEKKRNLVNLLIAARDHALLGHWRIVDHLLYCVQKHPATSPELATEIAQLIAPKSD